MKLDRMRRYATSDVVDAVVIGSGAGGTVYKCLHRPTGRVFALKVIYGHHEDSVRRQIHRDKLQRRHGLRHCARERRDVHHGLRFETRLLLE